ncbi:hypothetical protein [Terracidiphilus gabretensis]|uniref:hypothetical protein n=1 Tax=Terracidiphilus gabretensis TaxID=1577687 RepID=UPI00071BFFE9|nr:hypothetical protein [Terracidiphilus gabretensis]
MEFSAKAFIIHDTSGKIVSVGRAPANLKGKLEVKIDRPGFSVLEVELDADQAALPLMDIQNGHHVHVASGKLVKK